ncbi:HD-GYP domain-containing protein [Clostridium transplantifaecale]|uniref:HD-GYP domain-containing protein n=1 Tax=Clostridium transplantifaecale TaxID=2479838 RepID=UPI000F640997|nr:HD domain-containing phosphohydrolase [Clostridium transplantifaecale]
MEDLRKVILIVDDIELNRAILNELFYRSYRVQEAANGIEALKAIEKFGDQIAIILLDVVMPELDGFGFLKELKSRYKNKQYPVFFITAEDSDEIINRGYDMGVDDVINKPFNPSIIRRRVKNTIELYERRFRMESIIEGQTRKIKEQAEKLRETSLAMVDTLSTVIEFRDCESGEHVKRIRTTSKVLMEALGDADPAYRFPAATVEEISVASAMHDVGKIAIPDHILNKPGKLTVEEFEIMKEHTVKGCEILQSVDILRNSDSFVYYYDICRWHHEKWDGRGYPDGLKGDEIPIWAQVVALADCYDALVSERVYKPAYSHEKALEMIQGGECGQFNPALLNAFAKVSDILKQQGGDKIRSETVQ